MTEQTKPCSTPEARQFDFWIGDWDLTWGEEGKGTNSITSQFGGCVIQENFNASPTGLLEGMSVSTFDARDNLWKQSWVDNQGGYYDLKGEFKDGVMTLIHEQPDGEGRTLNRMTFFNIVDDSLDWGWERSEDGGEKWKMMWQIYYQRKT